MKIEDIEKAAIEFVKKNVKKYEKCANCKHFYRDGMDRGTCDIEEFAFDNGWEYIPAYRNPRRKACYKFEYKDELLQYSVRMLITNNMKNGLCMPIPSFDEILEANRDVLERIKYKSKPTCIRDKDKTTLL